MSFYDSHLLREFFQKQVLIIAGEPSGDLLGGKLIDELENHYLNFKAFGTGGEEMKKHKFESLEDVHSMTAIGITAALKKYRFLKKLADRIVQEVKIRDVKLAILIDYPGFNLRLAQMIKPLGVKIVYYVSPQLWAWKFNRIYTIQKYVDLMLVLFPFEKKMYDDYQIKAVFTGHPLTKRLNEQIKKEAPLEIDGNPTTVTLMPGSRDGEIKRHIDVLLQTAKGVHKYFQKLDKKIIFLVPNINKNLEDFLLKKIANIKLSTPNIDISYYFDRSARCIEESDLVIVTSGTATMEVVHFEKPMIIVYKTSFLTYLIATFVVQCRFIGLVNLLASDEICKEFIQAECRSKYIIKETIQLLENPTYRTQMIRKIREIKKSMGEEDASANAAISILKWIDSELSVHRERV